MTYSADTDPASMTTEQFVEDTRQMTDSLCKWYGVEKIYLMGHSWGSYLGIKTIEKHPELYHAYIGIGQVCNQLESERLAYDYIVEQARQAEDTKTVEAFEAYDKYANDFPSNDYLLKVRSNSMNKYGVGIKHKDCSMFDIAVGLLYYRGYTFMDKIHYLQGTMFSLNNMFHKIIEDNLFETSTRFEVRFIFFKESTIIKWRTNWLKRIWIRLMHRKKSSLLSRSRHIRPISKNQNGLSR